MDILLVFCLKNICLCRVMKKIGILAGFIKYFYVISIVF